MQDDVEFIRVGVEVGVSQVPVGSLSSDDHEVPSSCRQTSEASIQDLLRVNPDDEVVSDVLREGRGDRVKSRAVDAQSFLQLIVCLRRRPDWIFREELATNLDRQLQFVIEVEPTTHGVGEVVELLVVVCGSVAVGQRGAITIKVEEDRLETRY